MPKARQQATPTAKQLSRHQRTQRQKRLVQLGTIVVLALVLGILGYGYWKINVEEPASPVALVNGVPIRTIDYQNMVRLQRFELDNLIQILGQQLQRLNPQDPTQAETYLQFQTALDNAQSQREQLPTTVLDDVIDAELLRQLAEAEGIVVAEKEIDAELRRQLGFAPPPTPFSSPASTPSPVAPVTPTLEATPVAATSPTPAATASPTEDPFVASYRQFLDALSPVGVSEEFLRTVIGQNLIRQKMKELVTSDLPTAETQIHARHILVATEEQAEEILARIQGGESFAALAIELSLDQETNILGGDLGWFPEGEHEDSFDEAAFALQPGETSGVVEASQGFEIIQVSERDENRELSEQVLDKRKEAFFRAWLEEKRSQAVIQNLWTPEKGPPESTPSG